MEQLKKDRDSHREALKKAEERKHQAIIEEDTWTEKDESSMIRSLNSYIDALNHSIKLLNDNITPWEE